MKFTLYGFMTISELIDNSANKDSPLGELSDEVRTYALDKGYFTKNEYPDVRFISFRSQEDDNDAPVPLFVRDICIRLGDFAFKKALDKTIGRNIHQNRQIIQAEFNDLIEEVILGKMTEAKSVFLPQFIQFKLKDKNTYSDSFIKIWFSDPALKQQYPLYDIVPVPLVDHLDDFFTNYAAVKQIKDNLDLAKLHDQTNIIKGKNPYTLIKTINYPWYDPDDPTRQVIIPWTIIIYGPIGNNLDLIRQALQKWILANSRKGIPEWEKIFPDIFIPTEFIYAPFWQKTSVPGYRTVEAIYSPTIPVKHLVPYAKEAMKGYRPEFVEDIVETSSTLFKSLNFLVCGNPQNRLVPSSFYKAFPMYCLIGSRTLDFNRLDKTHQDHMSVLNTLLLAAETVSDDNQLPPNVSRVTRDGILYVSTTLNNIQHLVVAKVNYLNGTLQGLSEFDNPANAPNTPTPTE